MTPPYEPVDPPSDEEIEKARHGDTFTCDNCGQEVSGTVATELIGAGWEWKAIPDRAHDYFILCTDCAGYFRERRANQLLATAIQCPDLPPWDCESQGHQWSTGARCHQCGTVLGGDPV